MYCPQYGAGNQNAKAYCKSCGEWLPDITRTRNTFGGEALQQTSHLISQYVAI